MNNEYIIWILGQSTHQDFIPKVKENMKSCNECEEGLKLKGYAISPDLRKALLAHLGTVKGCG